MNRQVCVCFRDWEDEGERMFLEVFQNPDDAEAFCLKYEKDHPTSQCYFEFWDVK